MKRVLLLIALFLSACSYKNEPIYLKTYEANAIAPILKEKKSVHLRSVNDKRANKQNIGYVIESAENKILLSSREDFAKKYADALSYALSIAEFNTKVSQKDAELVVDVNIQNIELKVLDKSFDENLKGEIGVELVVTHGNKTTKYNLLQKQGEWMAPSRNSKDLEPFLSALFEESISAVVSQLAK